VFLHESTVASRYIPKKKVEKKKRAGLNLDSYLYHHGQLALALPSRELPADHAFQRREGCDLRNKMSLLFFYF
jgi:hypothetical protein